MTFSVIDKNTTCKYFLYSIGFIFLFFLSTTVDKFFYPLSNAISPPFELQEITNEKHHWVQTYGNSDKGLKSNYTDILAVDYMSDGNTLNSTIWLESGFPHHLTSNPLNHNLSRTISYGIFIDVDSNVKTGYGGADYDFYVEVANGKVSGYLYQLSSTGGYRLIGSAMKFSNATAESSVGPDFIALNLDLKSINFPNRYNLLFYTAESLNSNEVRQFTNWVHVPPPSIQLSTTPNNILIRQGEELLIPSRIKSTSGFSNDVINMTLDDITVKEGNTTYNKTPDFNSSNLLLNIPKIQPPLFKIYASTHTPIGIYTIPLMVTIREPSLTTTTKPITINTTGGTLDPEFELSKKYPTVGFLTKPVNLTVTVISPMSISDQFREFWGIYGQFIGIFAGAFIGSIAKLIFDRVKKKHEKE